MSSDPKTELLIEVAPQTTTDLDQLISADVGPNKSTVVNVCVQSYAEMWRHVRDGGTFYYKPPGEDHLHPVVFDSGGGPADLTP